MKNVRRIRGFSLLSAQHRAQYIQFAEPFSIEYKTDAASVSAGHTWAKLSAHTGAVSARHAMTVKVAYTGYVSASHSYTVYTQEVVPGALADAFGRTFVLDRSPLAPLEGALVDAAGRPFTLDVSALS